MHTSKRIKERMEEDTAGYSIELVVDFLGEGGRGLQSDCRTRKIRYTSKIEVPETPKGLFAGSSKFSAFVIWVSNNMGVQQYGCL